MARFILLSSVETGVNCETEKTSKSPAVTIAVTKTSNSKLEEHEGLSLFRTHGVDMPFILPVSVSVCVCAVKESCTRICCSRTRSCAYVP